MNCSNERIYVYKIKRDKAPIRLSELPFPFPGSILPQEANTYIGTDTVNTVHLSWWAGNSFS